MSPDKAVAKISRILESLAVEPRRVVLSYLNGIFGNGLPMTPAERQARHRRKTALEPDVGVTSNVTSGVIPPVTEAVIDEVTRPPKTPRSLSTPEVVAFPGFVLFWKQYPKRVGKGEAEKSWRKGNCESNTEKILDAIGKQHEFLMRDGGKFVPNPATWLNQKRWEDDPPAASMLSDKTRGNQESLRRFVERRQHEDG